MSKIGLWKSVFGHREKVPVNVGDETALLTDTQSYRFNELNESRDSLPHEGYRNPLNDAHLCLKDAAFRLMVGEDEVLARAAAGRIRVYVDVAGKAGHWCHRGREGIISQSSVGTVRSGLLKLRSKACADLAKHGRSIVRTLDFCGAISTTQSDIDDDTLANLRAWGPGDLQFLPLHPLTIDKDLVLLLPPLE